MPYLSTTVAWDTIRSLTHPKVSQKIADNITSKIPLVYFLNRIGHKEYENGGYNYSLPVFKEIPTAQAYSGLTVLNTNEADPVTNAIFERKLLTQEIVLSGQKLLQNSGAGSEAIVSYIAAMVEISEEGMKNSMAGSSIGIFSNLGEGDVGITGLQNIVSDSTTTGVCGGLDRASYSWWQHNSDSVSTGFNTDGLQSMRTLYFSCLRGDESPTVIVMTQNGYINLDRALTGTINYNQPSPKTAIGDVGFEHINFRGTPVIFDANCPTNRAYMLNLKYMKLLVSQDRDMAIRDFITPTNQDALVGRLYWAGNLVCNNLARQGVLQGLIETWA